MRERTPHLDPNSRGALVGLATLHERPHLIRAILEGAAFSPKITVTIFEESDASVGKVLLGGGSARPTLWRQIQADIYAHELEVPEAEEGTHYGQLSGLRWAGAPGKPWTRLAVQSAADTSALR
jgi:xylulokinase